MGDLSGPAAGESPAATSGHVPATVPSTVEAPAPPAAAAAPEPTAAAPPPEVTPAPTAPDQGAHDATTPVPAPAPQPDPAWPHQPQAAAAITPPAAPAIIPVAPLAQHSPALGTLTAGGWVPPLEPAPSDVRLARLTRPWRTVWATFGQVFLVFIIAQAAGTVGFFFVEGVLADSAADAAFLSVGSLLCALITAPVVVLLVWLRRPRLVHVQLARPDPAGHRLHAMQDGGQLASAIPTRFTHHLLLDRSQLEVPRSRLLWAMFATLLTVSTVLFVLLLIDPDNPMWLILALGFGVWAWLAGFSLPVFAWWSAGLRWLGVPTERRHGESAMLAGMLSTVPAIVINSAAALLLARGLSEGASTAITVSVVAPVGEELCKAFAVWTQRDRLRSLRHGFLIGVTVGLGFAIVENLSYVLGAGLGSGLVGLTLTAFVRGIGSIPGHALWTGLTGIGLAAYLTRGDARATSDPPTPVASGAPATGASPHATVGSPQPPGVLTAGSPQPPADLTVGSHQPPADLTVGTPHHPYGPHHSTGPRPEADATEPDTSQPWMLIRAQDGGAFVQLPAAWETRSPPRPARRWLPLPRHPLVAYLLAVLGHALWNGSSIAVDALARRATDSEALQVLAQLVWIMVLITTLLGGGWLLLQSVRATPLAGTSSSAVPR